MEKEIITVGAILLFGGILVPAIGGAFADAPTGTQTVENESVEISTSEWTPVSTIETADSFYDNETVYANGSVANASAYQWDTAEGAIRAEADGELAAATTVSISYAYEINGQWIEGGEDILWVVFFIIAGLVLVAGGMMILVPIFSIVDMAGGGR